MVDVCECAANWRIELTDLLTGAITKSITPVSFEFETSFLEAGRGTITFNRRGTSSDLFDASYISVDRMTPGVTGIYFQRIRGGSATPDDPVNMFGGFVETFQGNSDGTVTLGFAEIQKYLDYRMIRSDLVFTGLNQNTLARDLVMYARGENVNGGSIDPAPPLPIPLIGSGALSAFNRDRTYLAVERPIIGDLLKQLIGVLDGPVYQMEHNRTNGVIGLTDNWYSEMFFSDTVFGQPSPAKFITWDHVSDFTLNLDSNGLANQIDAFGDPEEDGTPRISTADSPYSFEPRYDAAPTFDGVTSLITLNQQAFGYQDDHRDPALNLQLNFVGLEYGTADPATLTIDDFVPGYAVNIDVDSPAWRFEGGPELPGTHTPSIGRVSVAAGAEGPEQVTVQIIVDEFPNSLVSGQPSGCVDCT